jgi:hypothetical protein
VSDHHAIPDAQAGTPARRTGGRRRALHAETIDPDQERRQGDRRKRPGLLALFFDILAGK